MRQVGTLLRLFTVHAINLSLLDWQKSVLSAERNFRVRQYQRVEGLEPGTTLLCSLPTVSSAGRSLCYQRSARSRYCEDLTFATHLLSQRVAFAQAACGERSHACTECTTAHQHPSHSSSCLLCTTRAQTKLLGQGAAKGATCEQQDALHPSTCIPACKQSAKVLYLSIFSSVAGSGTYHTQGYC